MTQSSPFGGRRDFDLALFGEDDSINSVMCRDYVSNNVLHAADQTCARVLVNWMAADDAYIVDNVDQFTTGYYRSDQWLAIAGYGPFSISVRQDASGVPVPYRIRAAVYAASATAATTTYYALQVIPGEFLDANMAGGIDVTLAPVTDGSNLIYLGSTSSATPAWLAPSFSGWCDVTMPAVSIETRSVLDVPGGTAYVAVHPATIGLRLLAYSDGAVAPRVYGLHVAEFFA
jgi:hypothetical protein